MEGIFERVDLKAGLVLPSLPPSLPVLRTPGLEHSVAHDNVAFLPFLGSSLRY